MNNTTRGATRKKAAQGTRKAEKASGEGQRVKPTNGGSKAATEATAALRGAIEESRAIPHVSARLILLQAAHDLGATQGRATEAEDAPALATKLDILDQIERVEQTIEASQDEAARLLDAMREAMPESCFAAWYLHSALELRTLAQRAITEYTTIFAKAHELEGLAFALGLHEDAEEASQPEASSADVQP